MLPRKLFCDSLFDEDITRGMDSDIYLKDGVYHIEMDIPGFNKEDIKIEMHKGTLTIKAEKEYKEDVKIRNIFVMKENIFLRATFIFW